MISKHVGLYTYILLNTFTNSLRVKGDQIGGTSKAKGTLEMKAIKENYSGLYIWMLGIINVKLPKTSIQSVSKTYVWIWMIFFGICTIAIHLLNIFNFIVIIY